MLRRGSKRPYEKYSFCVEKGDFTDRTGAIVTQMNRASGLACPVCHILIWEQCAVTLGANFMNDNLFVALMYPFFN